MEFRGGEGGGNSVGAAAAVSALVLTIEAAETEVDDGLGFHELVVPPSEWLLVVTVE